MSVDTKALRNEAQEIWTTKWASTVTMLCDEIDRLRKEVNKLEQQWYQSNRELAVERENSKLEQKRITDLCAELATLEAKSKELAIGFLRQGEELKQVREQLRPRSIKDEPPPSGDTILVWNGYEWMAWELHAESNHDRMVREALAPLINPNVWLPMPPAPPQPDAFGEWAESVDPKMNLEEMRAARLAWDAAIQSTKKQP